MVAKRRRIHELKSDFEQLTTRASDTITSQGVACDHMQEQVDNLQEVLQKASKQLKCITSQNDHAVAEKKQIDDRVASVARLEQRLNQMEALHASIKQLQQEKSALQTDLSASRGTSDYLAGQMERLTTENVGLQTERGQARDRLAGIVSLLPSSVPTTQALPS
ncbi:hypothetical protein PC129_g4118 [Phytophthora cactorum]|uniref:Uncharacterized protein n=1 Tax=Phytophthora cactorum TaxID=29920 RepID=A0A329SR70_9STRA|nr:hypothetical protein Pcac1_g13679 [Phytophthora cactorum]KAG2787208.1 hypothetical protein PC111_g24285 [Phytophthora cactorum]KAG2834516.1 hypothetical protein PC112_g6068 [Phytophthora cactorum]KAG2862551.1 hypothetical protein PC113_g6173 [Phytophthora cactorum]KAG2873327.1 hypothetical protein PC115_g24386 [Phytophthora cactorum]